MRHRKKNKINRIIMSKAFVALVLVALFFLGVLQVIQGSLDKKQYLEIIRQVVREQGGLEMQVKGDATISLLPTPTLFLPAVEMRRSGSPENTVPTVTADMLSLTIAWTSLFGEPVLTHVDWVRPSVEIDRSQTQVSATEMGSGALRVLGQAVRASSAVGMTVIDGQFVYHNPETDRTLALQHVSFGGNIGSSTSLSGRFSVQGHEITLDLNAQGGVSGGPLSLKLRSGARDAIDLEGTADFSADLPKINGKLSMNIDDLLPWLRAKGVAGEKGFFDQITNESTRTVSQALALPVALTGEWVQEGENVKLSGITLKGVNSEGAGKAELVWGQVPDMLVDLEFSTLDYGQWRLLVNKIFEGRLTSKVVVYDEDGAEPEYFLPKDLSAGINLKAKKLVAQHQTWENATLQATLSEANITINAFNIDLPGETTLALFGVLSQNKAQALRFEGSIETQGKSLRDVLAIFDESIKMLPDAAFGDFSLRSNLYVVPDQVRLSEADLRIRDLRLNGGLVAYFDANPRVEADVKLKDINFDYLRDVWRESQKADESVPLAKEEPVVYDKAAGFNWLRQLKSRIDFKVSVTGFTFLEKKGDVANFRIYAKDGEFGIYNIHMYYPDNDIEASLSLDVKEALPSFSILLNTRTLDTSYFSLTPRPAAVPAEPAKEVQIIEQAAVVPADPAAAPAAPAEMPAMPVPPPAAKVLPVVEVAPASGKKDAASEQAKRWSEGLIDMRWMNGFKADMDITIGRLLHKDQTIDSIKVKAKLENNVLSFQTASFTYWQGKCDIAGSIYGGKVPGVSIGFSLYNVDLYEILRDLSGRENVSGKVSMSGTLATSGVNYLSWISQAEAKIVLAGRGVYVDGFNLQGVVDAVTVSRTASDVLNNVNLALTKGTTTDMSVDGNINVKGGIVRTPGITLQAGTILGNLTGDVRLVPWTMDLTAFFQFPIMVSETVPTMTVQLAGPIAKPELAVDTSSLEAYVAKRIVGQ
jgi:hypothetical protein